MLVENWQSSCLSKGCEYFLCCCAQWPWVQIVTCSTLSQLTGLIRTSSCQRRSTCSSVNMRGSKLSSIVATEMSFCRISKRFKYTPVFLLFPLSHTHTHMHTLGVMCLIHSVRELCLYAAMIHVSLKSNRLVNKTAQTEGWQAPPTIFFPSLYFLPLFTSPHNYPHPLPLLAASSCPSTDEEEQQSGDILMSVSLASGVVTGLSNQLPLGMSTTETGVWWALSCQEGEWKNPWDGK